MWSSRQVAASEPWFADNRCRLLADNPDAAPEVLCAGFRRSATRTLLFCCLLAAPHISYDSEHDSRERSAVWDWIAIKMHAPVLWVAEPALASRQWISHSRLIGSASRCQLKAIFSLHHLRVQRRSRCASSLSIARSSAIAPRSTISTTSRSTTATAVSVSLAPHQFGAARACDDHLVFADQDVVLHSLAALERAAAALDADHGIGLAGAIGVEHEGRLVGRVRDRVVLLASASPDRRRRCRRRAALHRAAPCLRPRPAVRVADVRLARLRRRVRPRLRRNGLRVCAVDVPLTHNSLSRNIEDLDAAHAEIARVSGCAAGADADPDRLRRALARRRRRVDPGHAWRLRWLRESVRRMSDAAS